MKKCKIYRKWDNFAELYININDNKVYEIMGFVVILDYTHAILMDIKDNTLIHTSIEYIKIINKKCIR